MSEAHDLFLQVLDCLENVGTSADRWVDLFADDGVFDFPYIPSLGMPARFEGKDQIRGVIELISSHFSTFEVSNLVIHELQDGSGLFAEYHAESPVDGKVYTQDYVSRLTVENGKIKHLREYLNVITMARFLLPNGLADVPGGPK